MNLFYGNNKKNQLFKNIEKNSNIYSSGKNWKRLTPTL